jgi:hypothetical protein
MMRTWILILATAVLYPKPLRAEVLAESRKSFTNYRAPRTAYGDPDLQGLWTNEAFSTLEPPIGMEAKVSRQAATEREKAHNQFVKDDNVDFYIISFINGKGERKFRKELMGYNQGWLAANMNFAVIHGETRAAWIVDPSDGKVPYRDDFLAKLREIKARFHDYSNVETAPLSDRCLLGFGEPAGPPMLNQMYNSNYQIIQTPGYLAILTEMNHDVRIVRIGDKHIPAQMRPWMGDSIGHWEGDTLVIETKNLRPEQAVVSGVRHFYYLAPNSTVTEWLTRTAPDEVFYQFEVDEPSVYKQAWKGEIPMHAFKGPIYEYACHEGNRSLPVQLLNGKAGAQRGRPTNSNEGLIE